MFLHFNEKRLDGHVVVRVMEAENFALGYDKLYIEQADEAGDVKRDKSFARRAISNLVVDGAKIPTCGTEFKRVNCAW